jgi:flagellar motor component MotA
MSNLKDSITNIVSVIFSVIALVQVVLGAWSEYVAANPDPTVSINWLQVLVLVGGAVIAYFTGKNANGTKKTFPITQ